MRRSAGSPRSKTGTRVALALALLWVVIVVALYVVLVRLKLGGAQALRSEPAQRANGAPDPHAH